MHSDPDPHSHAFHPKTVSRVVDRIKALTLELLPIQVDLGKSSSLTRQVEDDARAWWRELQWAREDYRTCRELQ